MNLEMAQAQLPAVMPLRFSLEPFPVYMLTYTDELRNCTVSAVRPLVATAKAQHSDSL